MRIIIRTDDGKREHKILSSGYDLAKFEDLRSLLANVAHAVREANKYEVEQDAKQDAEDAQWLKDHPEQEGA